MQLVLSALCSLVLLAASVSAHDHHEHEDQVPFDYVRFPYEPIYRGMNGEVTADAIFSGITTFAKLPWVQCLTRESHIPFDIAFIGAPFVGFCSWAYMNPSYGLDSRIPRPGQFGATTVLLTSS
jgi:hypothetical protein